MLLYEVNGDKLTSKDVFKLYGNGSSSEDEHETQQDFYDCQPKTIVTYLSESDSCSDSSISSLTSTDNDTHSWDKSNFRHAKVNGKPPVKPLRSALKERKSEQIIRQRKDSLHSTEGVVTSKRRSLGPKQLRFCGDESTAGLSPGTSSHISRSSVSHMRSASPPSILQKSRGVQILGSRPYPGTESPCKSSEASSRNTCCLNNIQDNLDGALQHIKNVFPSPANPLHLCDKGVHSKEKVTTDYVADMINRSDEPSPSSCSYNISQEQSVSVQVPENGTRMLMNSPSSVGAVRHFCDNSRINISFRSSQTQRPSISSGSSHSLNKPSNDIPLHGVSDDVQSIMDKSLIPDLEDPVNPNHLHITSPGNKSTRFKTMEEGDKPEFFKDPNDVCVPNQGQESVQLQRADAEYEPVGVEKRYESHNETLNVMEDPEQFVCIENGQFAQIGPNEEDQQENRSINSQTTGSTQRRSSRGSNSNISPSTHKKSSDINASGVVTINPKHSSRSSRKASAITIKHDMNYSSKRDKQCEENKWEKKESARRKKTTKKIVHGETVNEREGGRAPGRISDYPRISYKVSETGTAKDEQNEKQSMEYLSEQPDITGANIKNMEVAHASFNESLQPPTFQDVGNCEEDLMGLSDDADANDMKQQDVSSSNESQNKLRLANKSEKNKKAKKVSKKNASKSKSWSKKGLRKEGLKQPKVARAAPKKGTYLKKVGSVWQKSILEVGAFILEQERQEEKTREEMGLPKGPRRSKRQRFKPQFHERAVREYDEATGCDRYKINDDGNVVFENIHLHSQPKENRKRKQKKDRRRKKRRKLQMEGDETDIDNDSVNRKVDHAEVTPVNKPVWAYTEDDPEVEQKMIVTQKFENVSMKLMDTESGIKGGKALELMNHACGFLEIPPGQSIVPQVTAQTEVYIVLNAPKKCLKFKLGENVWHLSKNDVFAVPKNNYYSVENLHLKRSVLLSFLLSKDTKSANRDQSTKEVQNLSKERHREKKRLKRQSRKETRRRKRDRSKEEEMPEVMSEA